MSRALMAVVALALAACSAQAGPASTQSVTPEPTPAATPAVTPASSEPSVEPEPSVSPAAPSWTGHPAEGLALAGFLHDDNPISQIFMVEADGTLRQVTGVSGDLGASRPVWSPDGNRIAFTGPKHGETTITGMVAIVNADGTDEHQIAEGSFPRWSPDGTTIVFQEVDDVTGEDHSSYLVDPETGHITDLGVLHGARWLGNDRLTIGKNSYAADGLATSSLYLMDLSSGQQTFVADWTDAFPSPDGTQMLLAHEGTTWLASADGEAIRELGDGADPVWSPDGSRVALAYTIDNDANPGWAIVDLEGNVQRSDIVGAAPTWSPDGTRLALEVYRPDMPIVQVIDLATGAVVWEEQGMQPAWRP
jgi:Tol biopolymer transport system component